MELKISLPARRNAKIVGPSETVLYQKEKIDVARPCNKFGKLDRESLWIFDAIWFKLCSSLGEIFITRVGRTI